MASSLQSLGYQVIQAGDGLRSLEAHARHGPKLRLLVLDEELATYTGPECVDRLRAKGDPTPVIIVSAGANRSWVERLDNRTFVLPKPFTMPELGKLVRDVLGDRPAWEADR